MRKIASVRTNRQTPPRKGEKAISIQITKKTIPLRGLNVSIEDVRRIVERLLPHVNDEGHREVDLLLKKGPDNRERRELLEGQRKEAFLITVTIFGRDGESLFGYGTEPFNSPNIPEPIESIYISNSASYQTVTGRPLVNNFSIDLDFSTPPLVDSNNPVSSPTLNHSNFTVQGDRSAWIASIHQAVMDILGKNRITESLCMQPSFMTLDYFSLAFRQQFICVGDSLNLSKPMSVLLVHLFLRRRIST